MSSCPASLCGPVGLSLLPQLLGSHLDALDPGFDAELLHQLPGLGYVVSG